MNSQLHLHTKYSMFDGTIEPKKLLKWAEENNCYAIASTDHGNGEAYAEFAKVFAESPVKYIPGVELYCSLRDHEKREHLIILPLDQEGFHAMIRCITAANENLEKFDGYPVATLEQLSEFFGDNSRGHKHVVATSACIQGPIAYELLVNARLEREAEKIEKKALSISFDSEKYNEQTRKARELSDSLSDVAQQRQLCYTLKNKSFKKRQKDVDRLLFSSPELYEEEKSRLEKEIAEAENAAVQYLSLKEKEKEISSELSLIKTELKKSENIYQKIQDQMLKADSIRQQKVSPAELRDNAKRMAEKMIEIFGKENFYAEIQYHGIPDEEPAYTGVVDIARELGLKIIATNDAHILSNSNAERKKRQMLRSLRFNKWEEEMVGDSELYVKTDEELKKTLYQILPEYIVDEAIKEKERLAERCNAEITHEKHYPVFPSKEPSEKILQRAIRAGKEQKFPGGEGWNKKYRDRVCYELEVMKNMGVIDYILIVADFLEYGRLVGKIDTSDPEFLKDPYNLKKIRTMAEGKVGMGVGLGRGSGAGSLICYLVGITDVDPLKYDLLFERFLNPDRVTMPDIDSDFSPDVREWTIGYVKHKYGERAVCGIMTMNYQAAKSAIRSSARLLGDKLYGNGPALYGLGSKICAELPSGPEVSLDEHGDRLKSIFADDPIALEIIDNAILTEGSCVAVGQHAAGIIISDNDDVREYLPLMLTKEGKWVTQYDKDYIEKIGLLKFDFLGLINLGIITQTLRFIQKRYGKNIEMNKVPLDDKKVFREIFASTRTGSVFQFESDGMRRLLGNMKPDKIEDLILLNALYRPGPLQNADNLIEARWYPGKIPTYICKEIKPILDPTYGYPVYQEQIMRICNQAAGFTPAEADDVRKCMSKKITDKLLSYEGKFVSGLIEHGAREKDAKDFWKQLTAFGSYAFNKSHSAAYAITAYYTGWLKCYYPAEYFSAILNYSKFEDFASIIADAKAFGVEVEKPDINLSSSIFIPIRKNKIRFGLSGIKGVASFGEVIEKCRDKKYLSITDCVGRTGIPKDVQIALISAGCFDSFSNQISIFSYRASLIASIDNVKAEEFDGKAQILFKEKLVTGVFFSGNPVEEYVSRNKINQAVNVIEVGKGSAPLSIVGVVTEYKKKTTKSGKDMATFLFSDETGTIQACCFPDAFEENKEVLGDNKILRIAGYIKREQDEENKATLVVNDVSEPEPSIKQIVCLSDENHGVSLFSLVSKDYIRADGIPLYVQVKRSVISLQVKVDRGFLKDQRVKNLTLTIN